MPAEVERATDAGRCAFGYVAYEAAAALDPQLAVHSSTPTGMPPAWFGICVQPIPVPPLEPVGRFVAIAGPELFFERRGDEVLLRPMRGTDPTATGSS